MTENPVWPTASLNTFTFELDERTKADQIRIEVRAFLRLKSRRMQASVVKA
jgi:hypothetical protein